MTNDNWDDWGKHETKYYIRVVDDSGKIKDIGNLKIGQKGLNPADYSSPPKKKDKEALSLIAPSH